ncbi:MAG: ATP-dependent DNA helicase RecG [Methylococcaceae bacterium]|nr:MAG: ATP-dependent DNA helicase RecG [Methylococcaceae bacterium]
MVKSTPQRQSWENMSVAALKGAGAATLNKLEKLDIRTVRDLLFHLPLRYEDRTRVTPIRQLQPGLSALAQGQVETTEIVAKGRRSLVCQIGDGSGHLYLRFFHYTQRQREQLTRGALLSCFGEVRSGFYGWEMVHPEYQVVEALDVTPLESGLTPVYPLTEGLSQHTLRRLATQAVALLHEHTLADWLPEVIAQAQRWPSLNQALLTLHNPPPGTGNGFTTALDQARRRLAFEELLAHHLSLGRLRGRIKQQAAPLLQAQPEVLQEFAAKLPFALTAAQQRVIAEVSRDLASGQPMLRLLQGDVGSGKTVVAAYAALMALAGGWQVALMAPTELLAEQHYGSFSAWLEPLGVRLIGLTARCKGAARRAALEELAAGGIGVAVGTHALFQEQVRFAKLGLALVDEQHRFGVHQRLALREKGVANGVCPHQLIMTATPIPRTLAMLGYADLDVSVIDELPPGRTPVTTSVIAAGRRDEIVARIEQWVAQGRQVYWVCTLIEESEALQCEAAEATALRLTEALPAVRVGLVHGRMKAADKDAVMQAFKGKALDLLVATTVIEVGVDVPNASLMIIENAERLGLAQLHQLRGRVGRGPGAAHCLLMYQPPLSNLARERLGILRETGDGFRIAEKDLQLRGPGEVLGTRQTGQIQFRIADLSRDESLLDAVKAAAESVRQEHPERVLGLIERWLGTAARYAEA